MFKIFGKFWLCEALRGEFGRVRARQVMDVIMNLRRGDARFGEFERGDVRCGLPWWANQHLHTFWSGLACRGEFG